MRLQPRSAFWSCCFCHCLSVSGWCCLLSRVILFVRRGGGGQDFLGGWLRLLRCPEHRPLSALTLPPMDPT